MDGRAHGPLRGGVGELPGHELAELRRNDGRLLVVPQLREAAVGGSGRAPAPLAAHVRRQRHDADDADDRRERPAHADGADGGVLPGAEGAEGADGDGPVQRGVARHELEAVQLPAHPALPARMVQSLHEERSPAHAAAVAAPAPGGRLDSLDAFRGITIAGMLIVNNPGSWGAIYAPLRHAEWHGWTPTDLIFPFFLFIVGVSLSFSFAAQTVRGASRAVIMRRAAKRAAIIFALGLVLHLFPDFLDLATVRIPGVLQRIALAFLLATPFVLWLGARGRLAALIVLLFGYWALQTLGTVPGG